MRSFSALAFSLCLLVTPSFLSAAPLDDQIETMTSRGAAARAHWGVYARDLSSGKVIADVNGKRLFMPASNRKIVSTALAAKHLSADEALRTEVHMVGDDLVVKGVGDPSWTAELQNGRPGRSALSHLAKQIAEAGITDISGDLVIDTSRFAEPELLPPGWNWEDFQTIYGSIPAVFCVDKSLGRVEIQPGRVGEPVTIRLAGISDGFEIDNQSLTGRAGSAPTIQLTRGLDGDRLTVTGSLSSDSGQAARSMPLGDPVRYAAKQFREELEKKGVTVHGNVRLSSSRTKDGTLVAVAESAPLAEILEETNEESDNFLAESLYLLAGAQVFGKASYISANAAEKQLWSKLDVDGNEWVGMDGCGLSRKDLITPHALVELLTHMKDNGVFTESLPVSGKSGTLRYRLSGKGMVGRVKAKTGTLDGVSALSGYVVTNGGRTVVFSVIANNYTASSSTIRSTIDDIVELMAR